MAKTLIRIGVPVEDLSFLQRYIDACQWWWLQAKHITITPAEQEDPGTQDALSRLRSTLEKLIQDDYANDLFDFELILYAAYLKKSGSAGDFKEFRRRNPEYQSALYDFIGSGVQRELDAEFVKSNYVGRQPYEAAMHKAKEAASAVSHIRKQIAVAEEFGPPYTDRVPSLRAKLDTEERHSQLMARIASTVVRVW
jgi:hypothetical protein